MSRRILQVAQKAGFKYFPNPLVEGKYKVIPPPPVPAHILRPSFVDNKNPQFAKYEGQPAIHTPLAIEKLRKAATVASVTLQETKEFIQGRGAKGENLCEQEIDRFVFNSIVSQGAYPTPIGFMFFPKSVCVSVNQCFVHGIPSLRPLEQGDKINIDVTAFIDGYHGDNNLTVFYGQPKHPIMQKVVEATQKALYNAIAICKPGTPFNQVGRTIEGVAKSYGFHVCEEFSGHGIGELLHMPPMVYHRYYKDFTDVMAVGQTFTIQPILTAHPLKNIRVWKDNFTAISENNPNAQFEHTVLIVPGGCEILTKRPSENIPNPYGTIKNL